MAARHERARDDLAEPKPGRLAPYSCDLRSDRRHAPRAATQTRGATGRAPPLSIRGRPRALPPNPLPRARSPTHLRPARVDDDDGMPLYQVITFQTIAPTRPEKTTGTVIFVWSISHWRWWQRRPRNAPSRSAPPGPPQSAGKRLGRDRGRHGVGGVVEPAGEVEHQGGCDRQDHKGEHGLVLPSSDPRNHPRSGISRDLDDAAEQGSAGRRPWGCGTGAPVRWTRG